MNERMGELTQRDVDDAREQFERAKRESDDAVRVIREPATMQSLGSVGARGTAMHLTDKRDRIEIVVGPGNYAALDERAVSALINKLESWLSQRPR